MDYVFIIEQNDRVVLLYPGEPPRVIEKPVLKRSTGGQATSQENEPGGGLTRHEDFESGEKCQL